LFAQGEDVLPIPGTKRRERLAENVAAVDVELSAADVTDLNAKIARLGVMGERYPPAMMGALNG
jgi:aryl-alcohol dehydrogenase-like predicted oxidoreductase